MVEPASAREAASMTVLTLSRHAVTGRPIIEIFDDSANLIGVIYPEGSAAIKIVSKHFTEKDRDILAVHQQNLLSYTVRFNNRK
jgi:hypothetical protein